MKALRDKIPSFLRLQLSTDAPRHLKEESLTFDACLRYVPIGKNHIGTSVMGAPLFVRSNIEQIEGF